MAKDIKPTDLQIQLAFEEMIADYHLYSEEKPCAIIVAGVSGSGKSTCIANLLEKISLNYFPIQADDYRKFHPKLKEYREKFGSDQAHKKNRKFCKSFCDRITQ